MPDSKQIDDHVDFVVTLPDFYHVPAHQKTNNTQFNIDNT